MESFTVGRMFLPLFANGFGYVPIDVEDSHYCLVPFHLEIEGAEERARKRAERICDLLNGKVWTPGEDGNEISTSGD